MVAVSMNFTDLQVLTLVRAHPGLNLYQLTETAKKEMNLMGECNWTTGKIQKAVERLKKEEKVETRLVINGGRSCQEVYCKI
jgi:hypothetical protein